MIVAPTQTRLPLTPSLKEGIKCTDDTRAALFQLSNHIFEASELNKNNPFPTLTTMIAKAVEEYVKKYPSSEKNLHHRAMLRSTRPEDVAHALREIGNYPSLVVFLHNSKELLKSLEDSLEDTKTNVTQVCREVEYWKSLCQPYIPTPISNSLWKQAAYWGEMGSALHAIGLPSILLYQLFNNQLNLSTLSLYAGALGLSISEIILRLSNAEKLLHKTKQSPIGPFDIAHYLALEPPEANPFFPEKSETEQIIEAIKRSRGPEGVPTLSRLGIAEVVFNFLQVGALTTRSHLIDPSGTSYKRLLSMGTVSLMQHLQWQPFILNHEVLLEIEKLKKDGANIIAISNHRSHFDALILYALFKGVFIAKRELWKAPILGNNPFNHPLDPSRWHEDSLLGIGNHIPVDRNKKSEAYQEVEQAALKQIEKGKTICWFPGGSRTSDIRGQEVGESFFHHGAANFAARVQREKGNTYVVVVSLYGTSEALPSKINQLLKEGVQRKQPVVVSFDGLIPLQEHIDEGANPREAADNLHRAIMRAHAASLGAVQAAGNHQLFHY